jgi:DNA/RNA endonuclease G (NUC1)
LETVIRKLLGRPGIAVVHVATGPLYEKPMLQLPHADEVRLVPSGYWKLVAVRGAGRVEAIGFIMDQNLLRNGDFCAVGNRADVLKL